MKKKIEGTGAKAGAQKGSLPLAVVGIGASAGGLEALQSFFAAMPAGSGMAFVVIQHLSPDHKSLMVELLARKTDIPVQRAEDGMMVQANNIYLIPPKKNLTIFHHQLLLKDQEPRAGINLPVDIFLHSLAEDQGERAVGIILSGTGSDGTRGTRAIKERGGLILIQDSDSAKFDGMPRAAASSGVADFILPPSEMPEQLVAWVRHPFNTRQNRKSEAFADETGLTRLFSLLRSKMKVDFTFYKPSTIVRRIERRIAVNQVDDLDSYVAYAEQNPSEISALYRELLIGVTSFFRDPEVMASLEEKALPELIQRSSNREIRLWVTGCSTGEEAYTLAILVREGMAKLGAARDVKIFATDIDRDAILKAGSGIYPESIAADIRPDLLSKYFFRHGETYQIARSIREMVVFAQHNLLKDPPFTRIDLVSCRNLLIYLQTNLQQHAISMFKFSLNPGGILLLGSSETLGDFENQFEVVDRKGRIYRSPGKNRTRPLREIQDPSEQTRTPLPLALSVGDRFSPKQARQQERLVLRLLDALAHSHVPLTAVVDEHLEILHTVGDPSGIFKLPSGRPVFDISRLVDRELAIPLATGIQKVFRTGEEIVYSNVRFRDDSSSRSLRLRMRLLPGRKQEEPLVIVFFEPVEVAGGRAESAVVEYDLDEETSQRLQDLEHELQFTRENLQATIEELETSNEELQATNEELLASNEELQSTNEELQSTNEELYTVNAEYQNKIIELTEVQNDVENLLSSSRIGIVLLDEDFCIRRYSPQAAKVFSMVAADVGRPIQHLAHEFVNFDPVATARQAQEDESLIEKDVQTQSGKWYLVRVHPYRVAPNTFAGVVLTLIDISPIREIRSQLENTLQAEIEILQHMPSAMLIYEVTAEGDLVLRSGNAYAEDLTGLSLTDCIGKSFSTLWPGEQGATLKTDFLQAYERNEPVYVPEMTYADGRLQGVYHVHAFRLPERRLAVGFDDITEAKQNREQLYQSEARYRRLHQLLADAEVTAKMGSWTWDVHADTVEWSDNLFALFGREPSEVAPSFKDHDSLYTPESMKTLRAAVESVLQGASCYTVPLEAIHSSGAIMPCVARGQADRGNDGKVHRIYGSLQLEDGATPSGQSARRLSSKPKCKKEAS